MCPSQHSQTSAFPLQWVSTEWMRGCSVCQDSVIVPSGVGYMPGEAVSSWELGQKMPGELEVPGSLFTDAWACTWLCVAGAHHL